ncbi:hypothetical protein [Bacillus sp. HSf4]|uniref:hypothetical protein n=1 Tax=Bacillus sp. HSf4 TaxID=3035514 RepID=UPI002408F594|nr:hypothetical protein [Bacillus sp. HSf4]WFA05913.1 hypothetical protein P3X63_03590 [Bacillus sp. HSf4]
MKKCFTFFTALLTVFMLLTACSNNEASSKNESEKSEAKTKSSEDSLKTDGPLEKVGQWRNEDDGTKVTLKKIAKLDKTFDLDPIKMKIDDVKVLERSNLQEKGKKLLEQKGIEADKYLTIQVSYSIENTSDKNIMFNGIDVITTSTKQQIDVSSEDMVLTPAKTRVGSFYGKVEKEGYIVVPYFKTDADELKYINIKLKDVYDDEVPTKYHDGITEKVDF